MIPNSEDGGNWESFDAHADLYAVNGTNDASDKIWVTIVYTYFDRFVATSNKDVSQIQIALSRSAKAIEYEENEKFVDACNEWRKVFGDRTSSAYDKNLTTMRQPDLRCKLAHCHKKCGKFLLAGVEGFEPPHDGTRTRCLTTWRHPIAVDTVAQAGVVFKLFASKLSALSYCHHPLSCCSFEER